MVLDYLQEVYDRARDAWQDREPALIGPHSWGTHDTVDELWPYLHQHRPPRDGEQADAYLEELRDVITSRREFIDTTLSGGGRWSWLPGSQWLRAAWAQTDDAAYVASRIGIAGGGLVSCVGGALTVKPLAVAGGLGAMYFAHFGVRSHVDRLQEYTAVDRLRHERSLYDQALEEIDERGTGVLFDQFDERVANPPFGAYHLVFYREDSVYRRGIPEDIKE